MKIDITEEEREFLERICQRAELFTAMNIFKRSADLKPIMERDAFTIKSLRMKFRQLDANLIKKVIDED